MRQGHHRFSTLYSDYVGLSGFPYARDYSTNNSSMSSQISIWELSMSLFNSSATPSFTSHIPQIYRVWIHTGPQVGRHVKAG